MSATPEPWELAEPLTDEHVAALRRLLPPRRTVAADRTADESCQRSTPGCAIDHSRDAGECETW